MLSSSDYVVIIIDTPPAPDLEASELALALAAFDLPVQVIFKDAGVFWLLPQDARKKGGKSASKVLSAFPLYGIKYASIAEEDIVKYSLNISKLPKTHKAIPNDKINSIIQSATHCFTF